MTRDQGQAITQYSAGNRRRCKRRCVVRGCRVPARGPLYGCAWLLRLAGGMPRPVPDPRRCVFGVALEALPRHPDPPSATRARVREVLRRVFAADRVAATGHAPPQKKNSPEDLEDPGLLHCQALNSTGMSLPARAVVEGTKAGGSVTRVPAVRGRRVKPPRKDLEKPVVAARPGASSRTTLAKDDPPGGVT